MSALTDTSPGIPEPEQASPAAAPAGLATADQLAGEAQPNPGSIPARPVIAVALLTGHPGNVRRDLDLSPEFVASIEANGILIPLRITPGADGSYRVIDGHRRLAAAIRAGLAEVPADVAADRAGDEPGQFLDMWTAHRHRNPLRPVEEADALFAAREAGATRARIRKATGLKAAGVTAALAAAKLSAETRAALEETGDQLSLDQLAVLAEFDGDQHAVSRLAAAARAGGFEHEAERLRQQRAEQAAHQRLRRDLARAGYAVTGALPAGAQYLTDFRHDGEDLTSESHAECPGRGVFFRSWDLAAPVHYCTDPAAHGHASRYAEHAGNAAGAGDGGETGLAGLAGVPGLAGAPDHGAGDPDRGPGDPGRRMVVAGNKAWQAASEVRGRWLAASLFARRTAPREAAQFAARQLLTMPAPLRTGLAIAPGRELFTQITGQTAGRMLDSCDTATAGRIPLLILAPIIAAYEQALTEGEGRNTWRTDRYAPCPRDVAGRYLAFLASLGYQLSGIEQSLVDGEPYTGEAPPGDPFAEGTGTQTGQPGPDGEDDASAADASTSDEPAGTSSGHHAEQAAA